MTKMKLLKITSWSSVLIITSLKMLSPSSKLKMKHCKISHWSKIFEMSIWEKTLLTKIRNFRLNETSLALLMIEINELKKLSLSIKSTINDQIDWRKFVSNSMNWSKMLIMLFSLQQMKYQSIKTEIASKKKISKFSIIFTIRKTFK